jgi:hypothetical protein
MKYAFPLQRFIALQICYYTITRIILTSNIQIDIKEFIWLLIYSNLARFISGTSLEMYILLFQRKFRHSEQSLLQVPLLRILLI